MPGERKINPQNPPRAIHGRKPKKNPTPSKRAERYQAKLASQTTPAADGAETAGT